jgi:methyltransferase (TIGR00027 family)
MPFPYSEGQIKGYDYSVEKKRARVGELYSRIYTIRGFIQSGTFINLLIFKLHFMTTLHQHVMHMKNPISKTAYYTLGVRAWDAALPNPACGDSFARLFMNEEAQKIWQEFKDYVRPNSSNASRHAIIDTQLREALSTAPDSQIIIIGAGFDTRAFRITGGKWVEVDEEPIISYKEVVLPATKAPNSLTRIPIDFARESLTEKLSSFKTQGTTHIIIEGVLMYLNHSDRQTLITRLQTMFPNHIVYCDLMRKSFFERYSRSIHEKILSLGASFTDLSDQPETLFLDNGYKTLSCSSIPLYAASHADVGIPAFMIRYFMKTLRTGYCIWRFGFSQR